MSTDDTSRSPATARDGLLGLAMTRRRVEQTCPDADELVAWRELRLAPAQARRVEAHVAQCERCFEAWVELSEAMPRHTGTVARSRWWRRLVGALTPSHGSPQVLLGAAAVVVLGLALVLNLTMIARAPLTSYELSLPGSADWRSAADEPGDNTTVVLTRGDRFELMLRPATAIDDALEVRIYVEVDGALETLETPRATELGQGTLAISGRVGDDIRLSAPRSVLLVTVARRGKLPSATDLRERLSGQRFVREKHWQAWKLDIEYGQP